MRKEPKVTSGVKQNSLRKEVWLGKVAGVGAGVGELLSDDGAMYKTTSVSVCRQGRICSSGIVN